MVTNERKVSKMKKVKIIVAVLGSLILILVVIGVLVFRKDICTLSSLKQISDYPFYEMTYKSDYGLDEFLKKGARTDDELVSFITGKVLKGMPVKANPDGACSTFTAVDKNGDNLFGRNFDYKKSSGLIIKCAPKGGYKSIAIVNLAHIGYVDGKLPTNSIKDRIPLLSTPYVQVDGMNERGLVIAVLVIPDKTVHQNTGKVPITTTSAARVVIDKASNVDEAIKLFDSFDMNSSGTTGYHFQIADASGNSAIIEYIDGKMQVLKSNTPYQAATNFELYNNSNEGVGQDRYEIVMKKLEETKGVLTQEESMKLLSDVSADNKEVVLPNGETIISNTQWSAVYNLDKLTVNICIGHDFSKVYSYSLK
jgi:predicted choloylglycine hydrolase